MAVVNNGNDGGCCRFWWNIVMWLPLAIACVKQFLELDNNKIINSIWETKIEDMDFNEDSGGNNYNNNNKESNESR
ncbi:hypothetical protein FF38_07524 [Lucilia cuprina]|uniref:Transmembrane protein n=1 Tax=Lucilia cuprina TaxID=7375 RepID=A0A0L0C159_LUCCU|nr:hypothetical protein FF38_07524 [Lucilia cuprina]